MTLDLTGPQQALLNRIISSDDKGLRYSDLPQSDAMRLALVGLVEIGLEHPRMTVATVKGRAFALRGVA